MREMLTRLRVACDGRIRLHAVQNAFKRSSVYPDGSPRIRHIVDYDEVINAVVAREELVAHTRS